MAQRVREQASKQWMEIGNGDGKQGFSITVEFQGLGFEGMLSPWYHLLYTQFIQGLLPWYRKCIMYVLVRIACLT